MTEAEAPAPPATRSTVRTVLRWSLAAIALAFVLWVVPFRDRHAADGTTTPGVFTTLRTTNLPLLLAALLAYLASTFVWSLRWRALLGLASVELSAVETWRVTLEAQAGGILLPGGLGGDALRVAYVRERVPASGLAKVVASIFVDRVVGLVTLASLAVGSALAFGAGDLGPALWFLAAIPICAAIGFALLRLPVLQRLPLLQRGVASRAVKPMLEYAADPRGPRVLVKGALLSLVVSALQLVVIRMLLVALASHPTSEPGVYVGATLGMMVSALPATPGAWGTADAAYVLFLGRAGVLAPAAAAVCLLYRLFWYLSGVVGALSALRRKSHEI